MSFDAISDLIESMTWISQVSRMTRPWQQIAELTEIANVASQVQSQIANVASQLQPMVNQVALAASWAVDTTWTHSVLSSVSTAVNSYRQWRQRYFEQLAAMLDKIIDSDQFTLRHISRFASFVQQRIELTPNPPWLVQRVLNWSQQLASHLTALFHNAVQQGVNLARETKRRFIQRQKRLLLKLLHLFVHRPPATWPPVPAVHPTYGRHTSIQICAPPCP